MFRAPALILPFLAGCGTLGLELTVSDSDPGHDPFEHDSDDGIPPVDDSEEQQQDDTRDDPVESPPELSAFTLAERQAAGTIQVAFDAFDLDGDLVGGEVHLTLGGRGYALDIPGDLDTWDAAGTSRFQIDASDLSPGETVNGELFLVDAAGHESASLRDSLVLSGSAVTATEGGDTAASAQDLGVLALPTVVEGDIYRASNDGSAYTGDLDWFELRVTSATSATFVLTWAAAGADYDLHLLRDGASAGESIQDGTAQPESFTRTLQPGSTYAVVVAGWAGPGGAWTLEIQ